MRLGCCASSASGCLFAREPQCKSPYGSQPADQLTAQKDDQAAQGLQGSSRAGPGTPAEREAAGLRTSQGARKWPLTGGQRQDPSAQGSAALHQVVQQHGALWPPWARPRALRARRLQRVGQACLCPACPVRLQSDAPLAQAPAARGAAAQAPHAGARRSALPQASSPQQLAQAHSWLCR